MISAFENVMMFSKPLLKMISAIWVIVLKWIVYLHKVCIHVHLIISDDAIEPAGVNSKQ